MTKIFKDSSAGKKRLLSPKIFTPRWKKLLNVRYLPPSTASMFGIRGANIVQGSEIPKFVALAMFFAAKKGGLKPGSAMKS